MNLIFTSLFQSISGDRQSYGTQDWQTASSEMPPQSSQGEIDSSKQVSDLLDCKTITLIEVALF